MLFPLPGKPFTIHPHVPKPDLPSRYVLEAMLPEIYNVKDILIHLTTLVNYTHFSNFAFLPC